MQAGFQQDFTYFVLTATGRMLYSACSRQSKLHESNCFHVRVRFKAALPFFRLTRPVENTSSR